MNKRAVGVVGLHEAGNLGDDLILIAVLLAIEEAEPSAKVRIVSRGRELDLRWMSDQLGISPDIDRVVLSRTARVLASWRVFRECRCLIVGGGGLMQTSHHPMRPYHWLRYLGLRSWDIPTLAIGLGLGPLDGFWCRYFRFRVTPFDECFVRERESRELAATVFGWPVRESSDFVDETFLAKLGISRGHGHSTVLGVSLRAWPGLQSKATVEWIRHVQRSVGATSVRFYVLESQGERGTDDAFTDQVANYIGCDASVRKYDPQDPLGFVHDMATCGAAISMKLHSSAIWDYTGTRCYPILYAPKMASFYGLPYNGLEIVERPTAAREAPAGILRSHEVTVRWLRAGRKSRGAGARKLSIGEHLVFGLVSVAIDIYRKVTAKYRRGVSR